MNRQSMITIIQWLLIGLLMTPRAGVAQEPTMMVYEGFTHPRFDIMVAAIEIGRIEEVMVEEGDQVTQGQIIARLEDSIQKASVRIAELQARMRGEVDATKAEAKMHQARAAQVRLLAKEDMARPDELLRAEADLQVADARHQTAIEQTQLRELELARYKLQLDRRQVRAPMSGVIAKVFHQPGEYITPGDPAVVRLLVTDQLYAVFNVPVEDTSQMKVGDDVRVYMRSQADTTVCKLYSLAPAIDGESGTLQVRVILDNKNGKLRAGDRCTMQLGPSRDRAATRTRVEQTQPAATPQRLPNATGRRNQLR